VGFLRSAGITRWLRLDRVTGLAETGLAEIAPMMEHSEGTVTSRLAGASGVR
jgi:hypothetical protein